MTKVLESIQKYLLYLAIAIFPVFILLNSTSPAVLPKLILLAFFITAILIVWIIKMVAAGSISFSAGKFDLAVFLLAAAYILSGVIKSANKPEAFFLPGTASLIAGLALIYFLINQLDKKGKTGALISLFVSGVFLSLSSIFSELGVFAKIPQLPAFMKDASFNPLGGALPSIIYLAPVIFIGISFIVKESEIIKKIFWTAASALVIMAMVILIGNTLPGKPRSPQFPSVQTSWEVAVGVIAKNPVFGVGPGSYLTAFNLYRPVSYNQTGLWMTKFSTANNFYLTSVAETGLLGLAALAILLLTVFKSLSPKGTAGEIIEKLSLAAVLIVLFFFPASPIVIFPLFIILGVLSKSENKSFFASNTKFSTIVIGIVIGAGILAVDFFGVKAVIAEGTFKKSLDALSKNDARQTYDLMQKAVQQNQKVDRYHASLAQVDMALAQSIANKKDITDADKKAITQLVQQAIAEGKATAALNPERSGNWEILAQVYRSIMPFATGADQFAIQTYSQAVALDPTNPNLRIALGGVYYALGRYDNAIDAFKLAVFAKPDLANAHYNLAIAYKAKKEYDNAITEMNTVLSLVAKDSNDYNLAKSELDNLEKNKVTVSTGASESLSAPKPVEPSNVKPPIEIPQ